MLVPMSVLFPLYLIASSFYFPFRKAWLPMKTVLGRGKKPLKEHGVRCAFSMPIRNIYSTDSTIINFFSFGLIIFFSQTPFFTIQILLRRGTYSDSNFKECTSISFLQGGELQPGKPLAPVEN